MSVPPDDTVVPEWVEPKAWACCASSVALALTVSAPEKVFELAKLTCDPASPPTKTELVRTVTLLVAAKPSVITPGVKMLPV